MDMRKARHQRGAEARLEFVELRAIHHACDDLPHVIGLARVDRDDAVDFPGVVARLDHRPQGQRTRLLPVQARDRVARELQRVQIVCRKVIDDAGKAGVHVAPAQILGRDLFTGGGLHERRAAQEDRALVAHDDRLVAHGRHIGAARGARAHHDGDLRDALRGHVRLVEKDSPEVVAIREHLILTRKVGAA